MLTQRPADAARPRRRAVDILAGRTLPGVFFFYDINPIQVSGTQRSPRHRCLSPACAVLPS